MTPKGSTSFYLHLIPIFSVVFFALLHLGYSQAGTVATSECPVPEFKGNRLIRIDQTSKFLYPENLYFTSSEEASSLCKSLQLESAKIAGKWEYKHLIDFIYGLNLNNTRPNFMVHLGAIKNGLGPFEYPDRQPPYNQLRYQDFNLHSGEYFTDGANCLAIEWSPASQYFVPISCDKKEQVMPLCQYKQEPCSVNSPSTIQDEDQYLNNLRKVGESDKYVYYGAMKQRSWHEAFQTCKLHKLKLLSFHKKQPELIVEMLKYINEYKNTLGTNMWTGFSWTSARFKDDKKFIFDLVNEPWNINDMLHYMRWNDQLTVDRKKESCILVTANGLRPVLCELPNYFLCFTPKNLEFEFPTILKTTSESTRKLQKRQSERIAAQPPDQNLQPRKSREADQKSPECEKFDPINSINFTQGGLTAKEIIGLIKTSKSLNFSKGLADSLPLNETCRWRIPHVKEMGELTKLVCPEEYVKPGFINKILNFIMIYYNSVEEQDISPERANFWKTLSENYSSCKNITSLILSSTGGLITSFEGSGKTGSINIISEKADAIKVLDYVIEGFWYMFEISAATCYKSGNPGILWLSKYFHYFRRDFTDQFKTWWVNPGNSNYGLLFGDLDTYESLYNLRACSVANFQRLDIEDLLLVRPVEVGDLVYLSKSLNQRI